MNKRPETWLIRHLDDERKNSRHLRDILLFRIIDDEGSTLFRQGTEMHYRFESSDISLSYKIRYGHLIILEKPIGDEAPVASMGGDK